MIDILTLAYPIPDFTVHTFTRLLEALMEQEYRF
jgi:hypothetical protein